MTAAVYEPDRGMAGKLRRRLTRLHARRPAPAAPGRGMVTFTFDDVPASSVHAGAPVLEARGLAGTWFVSMGLCGATAHLGRYAEPDELAALHARGHEVACHTFSHLDCGRVTSAAFAEDLDLSGEALGRHGWAPRTFAYPFGEVAFGAKREAGRRFALARSVRPGLLRRGSDLAQAPSVGLQGPEGEATALRWVARAARRRAWLILFTHDVQAEPSAWGCTPEALARVADAARAHGLDVVTAAEGARRMGAHA